MRHLFLVSAPLCLALVACGGDTDEGSSPEEAGDAAAVEEDGPQDIDANEDAALDAGEDFVEALRDNDGELGCSVIEEDAHPSIELKAMEAGAQPDGCVDAFEYYVEGFPGADVVEVAGLDMGTDTEGEIPIATVQLDYTEDVEDAVSEVLFWLAEDDEWRIRTVPAGGLTGS